MGKIIRVLGALLCLFVATVSAETVTATPADYQTKVAALQPGDTLILQGGDYLGLSLRDVLGTSSNWITIRGAEGTPPARITSNSNINAVEVRDGCAYLAIENLVIDGATNGDSFGVNAAGGTIHNIRVEDCTFTGFSGHQQQVAISTKVPTWGWIIRGNTVVDAGTGIYFGNSDGRYAFVGGLIENNLFLDCKGYNMQIKHQNSREAVPGMPTDDQVTIIRNNVFIKDVLVGEDGARPNLLIGGFPSSGVGSNDWVEVYGNVFHHNHSGEALIQSTGRVSIHDNIFMDSTTEGVFLVDHNVPLKVAYVYNNTFYDCDIGVRFASGADDDHAVFGNLMFVHSSGVSGNYSNASDNIVDTVANAGNYVNNPTLVWGAMDFYPKAGQATGTALDMSLINGNVEFDKDFNGNDKGSFTYRGAYAGSGTNPGWQIDKAIKDQQAPPPPPPPPPGDETPPTGTVQIEGGAATTEDLTVDLTLAATDADSGMGAGAEMSFSNDGVSWSPAEAFATTRTGWELHTYGGDVTEGQKTVYVRYKDVAGNWSSSQIAGTIEYQRAEEPPPADTGGTGAIGWLTLLLLALPLLRRREG